MSQLAKSVLLAAAAMIGAAGQAHAEWQQATTRHFVVYADDSTREVRDLAETLERFDSVRGQEGERDGQQVGDGIADDFASLGAVTACRKSGRSARRSTESDQRKTH